MNQTLPDGSEFVSTSEDQREIRTGSEMRQAAKSGNFGTPGKAGLYSYIAQQMANHGLVKMHGPGAGGPSHIFAALVSRSSKRRRQQQTHPHKRNRTIAPVGERADFAAERTVERVTANGIETSLEMVFHVTRTGKNEPGKRFSNYVQHVPGVNDDATRFYGSHPTEKQLAKRARRADRHALVEHTVKRP